MFDLLSIDFLFNLFIWAEGGGGAGLSSFLTFLVVICPGGSSPVNSHLSRTCYGWLSSNRSRDVDIYTRWVSCVLVDRNVPCFFEKF